jgi:TPR repeat protein
MKSYKSFLAVLFMTLGMAAPIFAQTPMENDAIEKLKLGDAYHKGIGVTRDDKEAIILWRYAAERGNARAQNNLGHAYFVGLGGLKENQEEGVKWFHKAAEQDDPVAQRNLGIAYHNGEGVDKDDEQAFYWWHRAVALGDQGAYGYLKKYEKKKAP